VRPAPDVAADPARRDTLTIPLPQP